MKSKKLDRLRAEIAEVIEDCAEEVQNDVQVSLWYPGHLEIRVDGTLDARRIPLTSLIDEAVDCFAHDQDVAEYVTKVLKLAEELELCASKLRTAMRSGSESVISNQ